jgi:hypothetical protein
MAIRGSVSWTGKLPVRTSPVKRYLVVTGEDPGRLRKKSRQCHPEVAPILRLGSALLSARADSKSLASLGMTPSENSFSAAC